MSLFHPVGCVPKDVRGYDVHSLSSLSSSSLRQSSRPLCFPAGTCAARTTTTTWMLRSLLACRLEVLDVHRRPVCRRSQTPVYELTSAWTRTTISSGNGIQMLNLTSEKLSSFQAYFSIFRQCRAVVCVNLY